MKRGNKPKNVYGLPLAKNIYDPPMAKNSYGPQMAKNVYGLPMAKNIYGPPILLAPITLNTYALFKIKRGYKPNFLKRETRQQK